MTEDVKVFYLAPSHILPTAFARLEIGLAAVAEKMNRGQGKGNLRFIVPAAALEGAVLLRLAPLLIEAVQHGFAGWHFAIWANIKLGWITALAQMLNALDQGCSERRDIQMAEGGARLKRCAELNPGCAGKIHDLGG